MAEQKDKLNRKSVKLVMVEDFTGVPVSVPEDGVEIFLERQKELRRRKEAGEPLRTPEEEAAFQKYNARAEVWLQKRLAERRAGRAKEEE